MNRFDGKVAIVTGAGRGIGAAVARRLALEGASLVLADRDAGGVEALASEISAKSGRAVTHLCDVGHEDHMEELIGVARHAFGRVDIGILNAGTEGRIGPLAELTVEDFDLTMRVNARSVFIGLKSLFPALEEQGGGAIVATASTAALRGNRGLSPYASSKHAVLGLVRSAAIEGAPKGIRVNAVCPGPVDTPMIEAIARQARSDDPEPIAATVVAGVPLGRMARPEEIAAMVAFLASSDGSYCNGGAFVVDGGATAGPFRAG